MAQLGLVDDLVREIRTPKSFPDLNIPITALAETGHGYALQQIIGDSTLSEAVRLSAAKAVMAIQPDAPARVEIRRLATSPAVSLDTRYEAARLLSPDAADTELLGVLREKSVNPESRIGPEGSALGGKGLVEFRRKSGCAPSIQVCSARPLNSGS